jgi:hypothetical protein
MATGYNLDQTGDVGYFEDITLGPNEESRWWFHWEFDERHWQRRSFVPVGRGIVTIVSNSIRSFHVAPCSSRNGNTLIPCKIKPPKLATFHAFR